MALYRRYRRARPRRMRRGRKVTGTTRSIAVRALKTARYVKKVANPEKEYVFAQIQENAFGSAGLFKNLNLIAQGDDQSMRQGDQIRTVSLSYTLRLKTTATFDFCRVIILVEKLPIAIGTAPVKSTLFDGADSYYSQINPDTGNRYKILSDKTYTLTTNSPVRLVKRTVKLGHITKFTDGTDSTVEKNNLWIFFVGQDNTTKVDVICRAMLKYTDV